MYVIHVQRDPRSYFFGKFQYIRSYQFNLDQNKMIEIMKELCEVGPKSLQKNFRVVEERNGIKCLVIYRYRKSLVILTLRSDNFMQLL